MPDLGGGNRAGPHLKSLKSDRITGSHRGPGKASACPHCPRLILCSSAQLPATGEQWSGRHVAGEAQGY